jgi:nucleoid-associated protein YejK
MQSVWCFPLQHLRLHKSVWKLSVGREYKTGKETVEVRMNARDRTPEQNEVVEQLAKDLHRHYRAGEKVLGLHGSLAHDHGWDACSKQKYFRQRAVRELRGKL